MKTTIYVRNGDLVTYRSFQKVCEREGVSVSEKIMVMIREYMAGHGEGNPQTLLKYAGEVMTLPKWRTCQRSQKTRVQGEIFCVGNDTKSDPFPPYWRPTSKCDTCDHYQPPITKHILISGDS